MASRLLPPVIAQASGSARGAMGRDPFDALTADHRRFVSLLTDMEQSSTGAVFHRTQLLLRLKRRMTAHALAEEDIIYPLLHDQANGVEEAKHLYSEHANMKIHLHALEQMAKDTPEWVERVRALKRLVEEHARHEEEIDFPNLRRALGEQGVTKLYGQLQREKAMVL